MNAVLSPVPPSRVAFSGPLWHRTCDILNSSMLHFRMLAAAGTPACDLVFTVSPEQLKDPRPIVISMKGILSAGAVTLCLLDTHSTKLAAITFTQTGENRTENPTEHQAELVAIPTTDTLYLRIMAEQDSTVEFALTFLYLSYTPDEVAIELPAFEPIIFPNWERVYQPVRLTALERLRRQQFNTLSNPTPIQWHRNLRIILHPHNGLSGVLATSGFYEPHELMVLKKLLQPGDTFIDCGANIGLYSLYAASLVGNTGKVLAFEPSVREMRRLVENISLNSLTNITCFSCALSDHQGPAQFSIAQVTGENTLAETFSYTNTALAERVTVSCQLLDNIIQEQSITQIKLIKIDVEGAELHVLRGAEKLIALMRPAILLELFPAALHSMHTAVTDIDMFLKNAGYRLHAIDAVTAQWLPLDNLNAIHRSTNILALPE